MNTREFSERLSANVSKVIKGKDEEIGMIVAAIMAKGHVLLQDVPGTGKTVLAKAIAKSIDGSFRRIQFTPDLLPSDVTGINFYNIKEQEFIFRKGPIFTNILLADEINRATPRTQSALLECMEERQATIDGERYAMSEPFVVLATQNPVEIQGTYPLPEAQLDRFLIRISLGYAEKQSEMDVLEEIGQLSHPVDSLSPVVTAAELTDIYAQVCNVRVNETVKEYIVETGIATRKDNRIKLGISTRGLLALKRMSQAYAGMSGRDFVTPQDVKKVAPYVISHRVICNDFSITRSAVSANDIVLSVLDKVEVPTERTE